MEISSGCKTSCVGQYRNPCPEPLVRATLASIAFFDIALTPLRTIFCGLCTGEYWNLIWFGLKARAYNCLLEFKRLVGLFLAKMSQSTEESTEIPVEEKGEDKASFQVVVLVSKFHVHLLQSTFAGYHM